MAYGLEEADYGLTEQAFSVAQQQRYAGDKNLWVQFHMLPMQDADESAKEGRPIFKDVEHVRIMQPGNKESIVDRPVTDMDIARFRQQYENWKAGNKEMVEGTPLEQWPRVTRAQVEELKYFNVRTVEQLAAMSDSHAQKFMGIQTLRRLAREDLDRAKDGAPSAKLVQELKNKDSQIAALQEAMRDLQDVVAEMKAKQQGTRARKTVS